MRDVIKYRANDASKEYTVMSYNILCNSIPDLGIKEPEGRRELVVARVMEQMPDMLGVQECTEFWYDSLCEDLGELYEGVGEVTNHERLIWRNAIFYRKDKFDLVETRTRWLSTTPDVQSKLDISKQYRVMTHVILRDKDNGNVIAYCNTHMGFETFERDVQNQALIDMLDGFEYPVLVTGDFNMSMGHPKYVQIEEAGYISAHELSDDHDERGTFLDSPSMIDFCFVDPNAVNIVSHRVVDSRLASDHHPVVVRFKLK